MSFDYDPYAVMTVVFKNNRFYYLCDSCGAGWRNEGLNPSTPLEVMRQLFDVHVWESHRYTREQTAKWHRGF